MGGQADDRTAAGRGDAPSEGCVSVRALVAGTNSTLLDQIVLEVTSAVVTLLASFL